MRTDRKKIFLYGGIGAALLAGLILWVGSGKPFGGADLSGDTDQSMSFELQNPVCSIQAAQGTEAEELDLPAVLRAVLPLEEVHMENFVQAEPGVNSASGDYDYYAYGYVAPRDEEELYRENKPVIYTITYAGDEKDPEGSMKKGYRVYGSLNGRENSWFACDEAGVITGEVAEVPVVWDTDTYDKDTLGVYQIAGEIDGDRAVECGRPIARVEIKDKGEMESFSVETAHVHAGPSNETESLAGKKNKAEEQTDAEATAEEGRTEDVSEGGGAEETGDVPESGGSEDVSGNDRAEEKEDVSGNDTGTEEEDVSGNDVSGNDIYLDDTIEYFEEKTPVVKRKVGRGTETDKIGLPTSLKAVFFREEEEEVSEFVQMEPDSEEAERAGYIAPENEAQLRREGTRVVYTYSGSPSEVLAREILRSLEEEKYGELEEPEKAYRLYGSLNGEEAGWYVCDENGTVTGRIRSVAVTWDLSAYDAETEGKYLVPAAPAGEYGMKGEAPCAEIEVAEPVCTCTAEEYNRPWEHERYCACFEPVQCMCREDEREDHDETNRDCPLWNHDIMELYRPDGVTLTWVMLEDIVFFLENGFTIPEEPRILYGIADMSENGGGANDVAQDNYMEICTAVDSAKGEWINYINTVWKNKGQNKFEWKTREKMGGNISCWDGGVVRPQKDPSGAWLIYSPEQLRYALVHLGEDEDPKATTITIKLAKDIDLNGSNHNWKPIIRKNLNCKLILDGQGHTIYNLGVYTGYRKGVVDEENLEVDRDNLIDNKEGVKLNGHKYEGKIGKHCVFIDCSGNGSIFKNLTFSNAKLVGWTGLSYGDTNYCSVSLFGSTGHEQLSCITIKDSLIFGGSWVTPLTYNGGSVSTITGRASIDNCYVENCYVYGHSHVGGMVSMLNECDVSRSYVKDTLIVAQNADVGGFVSCSGSANYKKCFVSNAEIYASRAGGFEGAAASGIGTYEDCFASGIIRVGGCESGGFVGMAQSRDGSAPTYTRCYSTTHVLPLYDTCTALGGFAGATSPITLNDKNRMSIKFDSCYAAGEVGNHTIDLSINNRTSNDRGWGGFVGEERAVGASGEIVRNATIDQYKYCYYDKQTTGMREWISGTKKSLIENGKQADVSDFSNNGIRGVMTSGTSRSKGGAGLADGSGYPVTGDSKGFVGFSTGYSWTRGYSYDQYPQIFTLYYADSTNSSDRSSWKGPDGQPSDEIAQTVSNASKASVQTVKLNTWENGSNWSSYGTRSDASYGAVSSTAYKGGLYTYDTVRDIVSPGTARRGYSGTWNELISGGAPAQETGWGNQKVTVGSVEISGTALTPIHPGVDWFEYRTSGSVNSQTGRRPIRLNCLMTMDAGADTAVTSGEYYNHRRNSMSLSDNSGQDTDLSASPVFRMATAMNDKLVLGMDNSKYWSEYILGRYGHATRKYYNVSPKDKGYSSTAADLTTNFPTGKDSRIYTEIWRAKKDSSGNWVEDIRVSVSGDYYSDNNTYRAQQRWNGNLPMYTDLSTGRTYIVRYYWLLKDGRYITDSRTVTVNPDTYYLTMQVRNSADSTLNSSALYVNASSGIMPAFSTTMSSQSTYSNCPYTGNAVAAWRETDKYMVTGIKLEMLDKAGTVIGTNEVRNTEVKEGTSITVSYPKEYFYKSGSYESASSTTVTVTYTVKKYSDGRYYLVFNKMKNAPSDEVSTAKMNKDSTGISGGTTNTYINDMQNNVRLTLYVEPTNTLTVKKELDENARKYGDTDKLFAVDITLRTGASGTGTGYTGTASYTGGGIARTLNFVKGKATAYLRDNESVTIKGIPKKYAYYTVEEQAASKGDYYYDIYMVDTLSQSYEALASRSFAADSTKSVSESVTVKNKLKMCQGFEIRKNVTGLEEGSRVTGAESYKIDITISSKEDFSDRTFSGNISGWLRNKEGGREEVVMFEQGKATVELKDGESIEFVSNDNRMPYFWYFKVEEQAGSALGFDVIYACDDDYSGITQGMQAGNFGYYYKTVYVHNIEQPIPYYELPNAGGMGTYGYTAGGAAVMMTALLLFIKYLRAQKAQRME